MKCCYSKLTGYTRRAGTINGAVIYQSLRYVINTVEPRSLHGHVKHNGHCIVQSFSSLKVEC